MEQSISTLWYCYIYLQHLYILLFLPFESEYFSTYQL